MLLSRQNIELLNGVHNSGSFIAFGATGIMMSEPSDPAKFTQKEVKVNGGQIDIHPLSGVNYFGAWGDNKLYLTLGNKIYLADKGF